LLNFIMDLGQKKKKTLDVKYDLEQSLSVF